MREGREIRETGRDVRKPMYCEFTVTKKERKKICRLYNMWHRIFLFNYS